jgi:competence protein ComEA
MTRDQQWVVVFLCSCLILFFFITSHSNSPSSPTRFVAPNDFLIKKTAEEKIFIEVDGSVTRRGVYTMAKGERILDAIEKAGGVKDKISLPPEILQSKIEKSCRLQIMPEGTEKGKIKVESFAPQKLPVLSIPIAINTASLEELDTLPGIGPTTAQAIMEYREQKGKFSSPEDLLKVKGIGPKKLAVIRPHITVP